MDWAKWFGASQFSARSDTYNISNFSFTPGRAITFDVTAIPEPSGRALTLLALLGAGAISRRRRHARHGAPSMTEANPARAMCSPMRSMPTA